MRIKQYSLSVLLFCLWIPFLQGLFNIFDETGLDGAYVEPEKPQFSLNSFANGEFQARWEEYEDYNFGFRPFLIRLKNGIEYQLFTELDNEDIIEGKSGYLYSKGSAERTMNGTYYNGIEKNRQTIARLKYLQRGVENAKGKFVVVMVPSKEIVLPEYLPASFGKNLDRSSDYDDLVSGFSTEAIPHIDLCQHFKELKKTSQYPLFTKTGYHWSTYGAALAQDTILKYCEFVTGNSLHKFKIAGIETSDTARDADADFEEVLNLPFSLQDNKYYYPIVKLDTSNFTAKRPKIIIIGDSFFWQLKNLQIIKYVFSEDSKYWYYFKKSFPLSEEPGIGMDYVDIVWELESADIVMIISNLGTLGEFPFGVAEYYESYYSNLAKLDNHGRQVRKIYLKAANSKFVCADSNLNGVLIANRDSSGIWEQFGIYYLKDGQLAFSAHNKKYWSAELEDEKQITATRGKISDWETFTLEKLEGGLTAIKTVNGKYLSIHPQSLVIHASADSIGVNEKFKIVELNH